MGQNNKYELNIFTCEMDVDSVFREIPSRHHVCQEIFFCCVAASEGGVE